MKNCRDLELIEIMIVVVIIGLLAAMAMPAFEAIRNHKHFVDSSYSERH